MKMVMAIINSEDSHTLLDRLVRRGLSATVTNAAGGYLRIGNTMLYVGVEEDRVDEVLTVIREGCTKRTQYVTPLPPVMEPGEVHIPKPIEKEVGGATIFVLDVAHFEQV